MPRNNRRAGRRAGRIRGAAGPAPRQPFIQREPAPATLNQIVASLRALLAEAEARGVRGNALSPKVRELERFLLLADLSTLPEQEVADAMSLIGRARVVLEGRQPPRPVVAQPLQRPQGGFELKSSPSFGNFLSLGMAQERKSLLDAAPGESQEELASALASVLRSHTKARLFTEKDLVGFYQVAKQLMPEKEQQGFVYVALGRSPAVLAEFLRQAFNMEVIDLPLGGLSDGVKVELTLSIESFLRRYLPVDKIRHKTIILIDYAYSGKSIRQMRNLVEKYAAKHLSEDACKVMIAPISWKASLLKDEHSVMSKFDWETKAAHRLLKVLFTEIDKDVYAPNKSVKFTEIQKMPVAELPDLSQIALPQNRQALEKAMQAALRVAPADFSVSEYLRPRSKKKRVFSYTSGYGMQKSEDEAFFNKLRDKSVEYYNLDLVLERYIHIEDPEIALMKAREEQADLDRQRVFRKRRIMALVFLGLFCYAAYWICSTLGVASAESKGSQDR